MLFLIAYLAAIFSLLIFLILLSIFVLFLIYSTLMGAPYVPTQQKEVDLILKEAKLKKGAKFIELGCGDGRVIRTAALKYDISGTGIDVNPILIQLAKFKAKWQRLNPKIFFQTKNIFDIDLSQADYVYLFLMPELINKLKLKLDKELSRNALVISHGFKITGWEGRLYKTIDRRPFGTYYYRMV